MEWKAHFSPQVPEVNKFLWIIKPQNWISAQFQFVVSFCAIKHIYFYEPPYSPQSPKIKGTSCHVLLAHNTIKVLLSPSKSCQELLREALEQLNVG